MISATYCIQKNQKQNRTYEMQGWMLSARGSFKHLHCENTLIFNEWMNE